MVDEEYLQFEVSTCESHLGDIVGQLNRFGAYVDEVAVGDSGYRQVKCRMTMTNSYQFERWARTLAKGQVKLARI